MVWPTKLNLLGNWKDVLFTVFPMAIIMPETLALRWKKIFFFYNWGTTEPWRGGWTFPTNLPAEHGTIISCLYVKGKHNVGLSIGSRGACQIFKSLFLFSLVLSSPQCSILCFCYGRVHRVYVYERALNMSVDLLGKWHVGIFLCFFFFFPFFNGQSFSHLISVSWEIKLWFLSLLR